jgi:hypothetical protein
MHHGLEGVLVPSRGRGEADGMTEPWLSWREVGASGLWRWECEELEACDLDVLVGFGERR